MKKALVGVGIGCGVLILLGVIAMVGGGLWMNKKLGGVQALSQKVEAQYKELKALDAKFPFKEPPADQPLKLDEARLKKYLAVRQTLLPFATKYEEKIKALSSRERKTGLGDVMASARDLMGLQEDLRNTLISQLQQQEMSPAEFYVTTDALYRKVPSFAKQRELLEKKISALEAELKADSLPATEKPALQVALHETQQQLANVSKSESGPAAEIRTANGKLLDQYQDALTQETSPGLDGLLNLTEYDMQRAARRGRAQQPLRN